MRLIHQTIPEFKDLELATLIDMLAELTETYTKMIAQKGFSPESETCRQIITNLQSAIKIKQDMENNEKRSR
jgi:hypothetical protein